LIETVDGFTSGVGCPHPTLIDPLTCPAFAGHPLPVGEDHSATKVELTRYSFSLGEKVPKGRMRPLNPRRGMRGLVQ
jgi:hypothetical protein